MQRSRPLITLPCCLILLIALLVSVIPGAQPLAAQPCRDEAELIEQSFDPPLEVMAPDAEFTVTWTLRNVGDCTWSRAYRLIFINGDRMQGARTTRLRSAVAPDETVTFALEITAPNDVDNYAGTWRLRNAAGTTFGPELSVAVEVSTSAAAAAESTDVVLPEVLAFGGLGGAGDAAAFSYCVEEGVLSPFPKLVVDYGALEYHYTTLYICSLPEGTEVTVTVTDPRGNVFSRDYVEDAPTVSYDDEDNEYFGTVLQVPLAWLRQAPAGEWEVTVTTEEFADAVTLEVPPFDPPFEYPSLDNWPTAPVDPFAAALGCHYAYLPGQELMISGDFLPPNAQLTVGVYQDRMSVGYLVDQLAVESDANGQFVTSYNAWTEPGMYSLIILGELVPEGFSEDGVEYDLNVAGESASGCAQVILAEEPEMPLRLLFAEGEFDRAELQVIDMITGESYYAINTGGDCSASEAAWWPDGEWIIYHSNCIHTISEGGWLEWSPGSDYELYASMIDYTYEVPAEEKLVRLTATPKVHELDPDANADGLIVYRHLPVGDPLAAENIADASGELHVLDVFEETDIALGLFGRAPTWSPDGTRIAFMSDIEGTWQIYAYDFETDDVWLVSRGCATHCRLPAWSPDGDEIIYHQSVSQEEYTPNGLWIAPAKGIARPRLFLAGQFARPSWSEAGWIAFQGPGGIYRAADTIEPGAEVEYHRYLYSDPESAPLAAPMWSR